MKSFLPLTLGVSSLALAACGGPQFTPLHQKILNSGPAVQAVADAKATSAPQDAYRSALRDGYLEFAAFELNQMNDYTDAIFHSKRAVAAASGGDIGPQALNERRLTAPASEELGEGRARLVAALDAGGATIAPAAAGNAVSSFDCWMEQQEEGFQAADIANCKERFETALAGLETQVAAQSTSQAAEPAPAIPAVITLGADVLFAFDSAEINQAAAGELSDIAGLIKANPGTDLTIQGHTDSVGSDDYNLALSNRRARSVQTFLIDNGVNANRLTTEGKGETDPVASNDTAEGRAQNRRVDIVSQ